MPVRVAGPRIGPKKAMRSQKRAFPIIRLLANQKAPQVRSAGGLGGWGSFKILSTCFLIRRASLAGAFACKSARLAATQPSNAPVDTCPLKYYFVMRELCCGITPSYVVA